jgi:predicted transposase/invertase (TIGR01784 family)
MLATRTTASTELKKAIHTIKDLNADNRTRQLAEERVKYWRDYLSSVDEADIKGFTRGMEKGKAERDREIALNLFGMGLDSTQVSKATNIPISELEGLKNKM